MNNLWNRSVGPFDEAAAQRHRHMGLLDCNGDVNADAVNFLAHLCAGLFFDALCDSYVEMQTVSRITIFAVVLALLPEKIAPTHAILLGGVMLATSIMLWYMDSFFLTAEKNYRQIYSWILKERPNGNRQLQYELDFNKYESEAKLSQSSQRDVAFSKTLKCFYGMPTVISFIYLAVQLVLSCSN